MDIEQKMGRRKVRRAVFWDERRTKGQGN